MTIESQTTPYDREGFIRELYEQHDLNEWGGSVDPSELEGKRFAVVIHREDDAWIVGADSDLELAQIIYGCMNAEYTSEWVDSVHDLTTGELYPTETEIVVSVNGTEFRA